MSEKTSFRSIFIGLMVVVFSVTIYGIMHMGRLSGYSTIPEFIWSLGILFTLLAFGIFIGFNKKPIYSNI